MKKKAIIYVVFASLCAVAIENISYFWRKGILIGPQLQKKYYIGALLILVCIGLELLSLYGLRKEVRQIAGKNKTHWNNIVQFVFTINCIGLPIYLIVFWVSCYLAQKT